MVLTWDPWGPGIPLPPLPVGVEPPMVIVRARDPRGIESSATARDPRTQEHTVNLSLDARAPFNVLVVVIDDVGRDQLAMYDALNGWDGSYPYAATPTIDALAAGTFASGSGGGVRFNRFWAAATCSPFRAAALTGLRVPKHALGVAVNAGASATLADVRDRGAVLPAELSGSNADEPRDAAIKTAAFGKWHLGRGDSERSSPRVDGRFRRYVGQLENVNVGPHPEGTRSWNRFALTSIALSAATPPPDAAVTQTVVLSTAGQHLEVAEHLAARTYLAGGQGSLEPWFVWRAHHFAHRTYSIIAGGGAHVTQTVPGSDPAHPSAVDTANYHSFGVRGTTVGDWSGLLNGLGTDVAPMYVYGMMLETVDTMLAGLLSQLTSAQLARTVVIVCGDNGTDDLAWSSAENPDLATFNASGNYDPAQAKATMYEGGIGAPLIVWGGSETGIQTGVSDALVEGCDIYATAAEALGRLGAMPPEADSKSLWPILRGDASEVRAYQYMQRHQPEGAKPSEYTFLNTAVRRVDGWKLITFDDGTEALFDTANDPFEKVDELASEPAIAAELRAECARVLADAEEYLSQ